MKKILPILFLIVLIPQIAFASWWNPISWFNNWSFLKGKDSKTEVLESRIKELEDKLGDVSTSTLETKQESSVNKQKENVVENKTETPTKTNQVTTPIIKTQPVITPVVQSQPTRDYKALYDTLSYNFRYLRDTTTKNELTKMDENGHYDGNESIHYKYIYNLNKKIDEFLINIIKQNPTEYDYWESIYNQTIKDYDVEKERYTRTMVINFFKENKSNLYQLNNHVKAANILDLYDRIYGTKYTSEFKITKTQQETIEFANSFLLDMGVNNN